MNKNVGYWTVDSTCESVHILSERFKLENEMLDIDGFEYTGEQQVNQVVNTNGSFFVEMIPDFTLPSYDYNGVYAPSDDYGPTSYAYDNEDFERGFILNWRCTDWGELEQALDGTCDQEKRPKYLGTSTVGDIQRVNGSDCGKTLTGD